MNENQLYLKDGRQAYDLGVEGLNPGYIKCLVPYTEQEFKKVQYTDRNGVYSYDAEKKIHNHSPRTSAIFPKNKGHIMIVAKRNLIKKSIN